MIYKKVQNFGFFGKTDGYFWKKIWMFTKLLYVAILFVEKRLKWYYFWKKLSEKNFQFEEIRKYDEETII